MKRKFTLPKISLQPVKNALSKGLFKLPLAFSFFIFALQGVCYAQPTVLGTDIVNGSYVTYNLNTVGAFKQVKIQALNNASSGLLKWEFCRGAVGSEDYSTNWRPYTAGQTVSGYDAFIDPASATASARWNTTFGGQSGFLPAVTANNYYTFNVTNNAFANNNMGVLETSYNPATISSVTRAPATVGAVISPTITVTMSAAPSAGENVYVRYSTNAGFTSSTIVQLSFVGATGTASIPLQAAGTTIYYYVYSSTRTKAAIDADVVTYGQSVHDMATLNLNNNAGANYSYTVLPVTVNATNAANNASYATLAAAFAAINAGTHTGADTVWIGGNTTETVSAVLNASGVGLASYTKVTVKPSGFRTVTGNLAAPLVDLNGADNVTIDGLSDGSNTLTFTNSNNTNTAGTSTIRMYNGATIDSVQNCILEGSTLSTTDGIITLGTGTNTTITVNANTIRPAGANLPIYSINSSQSGTNTAVVISGNNIQDYFSASVSSSAIIATANVNAWTISTNRFYQTASRTVNTLGAVVRAIYITGGGGHTISANTIGFANSTGTGTTTYITTQTDNRITPIELAGNATVSSIQGNVIANISITSASNLTSATAPGIFSGIYVSSGAANIGTVTGNIIGATTGTGSISISCSVTGIQLAFSGICVSSSSPNTVNIQNNNIGSLTIAGTSATVQFVFQAIYLPVSTANYSITDNLIGSTSTANSVAIASASTSNATFIAIVSATSGTINVVGNTIQNCTLNTTGFGVLQGIQVASTTGVLSITNNNIISCTNAGTGGFTAIYNTAPASTLNISDNVIRSNTITSGSGLFIGIYNVAIVTTAININNNKLGNASGGLITFSVANTTNVTGIYNAAGASTATLTIQANDFRGITHNVAGSGNHTYILNSAATLSQNINTNTFTALSVNTTGGVTFISNSVSLGATGTKIIKDNAIVTSFTKTGGGSNLYFYFDAGSSLAGATITNEGNNFSNVTINGVMPVQGWFNTDGSGTAPTKNIFNNTFNNISSTASSVINPIQVTNGTGSIYTNTITNITTQNAVTGITVTAGSFNIYSNTINTLSSSTSFAGVTGINISGGTTHNIYYHAIHSLSSSATSTTVAGIVVSAGTTVNIYKNKIYGLSSSAALASGGVYAINVTGGTTITLHNNLIGNLAANAASFDAVIRGINIGGGTTVNLYYNTVHLFSTLGGTNFGSSALYTNTTTTLNLRNNILSNISNPFGTGKTVAFGRNGASFVNYGALSNNNLFYAGTPGANRLVFFDGTTGYQTLAAYQAIAGLSPRDNLSVTAALTFVSTTGSSLNFLHLNTTSAAESGAANIAGFTDDYDDEVRQGNAGYTGTGTAPDIGADEFESVICPATPTITGISPYYPGPYYAGDVISIRGANLTGITYATINDINATIVSSGNVSVGVDSANLIIPVTMADSVGVIQVAATSSCTFSNTINFVFAGYITKGGQGAVNWGTNTIWRNNALPVANAPAIINTGDNVTLNVAADPIKFTILAGAGLIHQNNSLVFGTTYLNNTTVNGTLVVDNAGAPVLSTASRFISPKLMINNGGTFTNNSANAAAVNIANFYVYAGGNYNHNAVGSTGAGIVNDFPGSTLRSYGNTSNVVITKWANGLAPINLPASGSPGWGNLTINVATLAGSWNQIGLLANVQGNLNIQATGGGAIEFRLTGAAANTTNITGNLVVSGGVLVGTSGTGTTAVNVTGNTTVSGGTFTGRAGSGGYTLTVGGTMTVSGGTYTPTTSSGATATTTVTGAFTLSSGIITSPGSGHTHVYSMASLSVSGGTWGMSSSSSSSLTITTPGNIAISGTGAMTSTSSGNITVNCTGNFSSTSTASSAFAFQNGSSGSKTYILNLGGNFSVTGTGLFVGGSSPSPSTINFTGGAASVSYNAAPSVMATTSPVNVKNNFFVTSGKTLTLLTSILPSSSSTSNNWNFTVNTGATLVCGTNEIGTNAVTARTGFTIQTGATLKTANAGGVWNTTTGSASITTTAALASLSAGATYEFNGTAAQVTSAFATTPAATPSNVANMVINNTNAAGVTLSASFNITAALQMQTGTLTLSTFNLTAASITGAPYSNTKMVITNSTGALGQPVALATILYPVGNSGNYTPASYTFTANSTARNLFVRAVTPRNANDVSVTDYIDNRWWNTSLSDATGSYTYTSVYTYISGDMVGTAANIRLNRWTGSAWVNDAGSVVNNTNFTITSSTGLTETTGTLAATAEWVGRVYAAPAVYTWTNPVNGSWLDASKWTPNGVPGSGDGVIFDKVGAYNVFSMPVGITLTQMHNTGSTLNLRASGTGIVNISTASAAPQFRISAGASTTLDSLNAVNINLIAGASGNLSGSLNLQRTTHTVTVVTAGNFVVPSGGYFSYGSLSNTGYSGNPFGTTGTNGSVLFQNGSVCECFEGSNPFGNLITDNLTTFQAGSLFRFSHGPLSVASPSVSGRTYSNFTYNSNKVTSIAAASSFICDSLTVTVGTFNLNLQGTPTPDHSIRGNINVSTGATLTFSPSVSGTVNMNSGSTQIIWGGGTFSVNSNAILDINAGTTASLQKNMDVSNPSATTQGRINVNGSLILNGENYIASLPFAGGGLVQLQNTGSIYIQSANGINTTGVSGNIRTTNFGYTGTGGNFIYSGTANQVTGNRLPLTLGGTTELTIANTGTAPNNVVTLSTNSTTTPRLNLNTGQFNAGTTGTLNIAAGGIVSGGGGNQYLAGAAADNIINFVSTGSVTGTPELYNVTLASNGVDFVNNARINGILLLNSGSYVNNNAPKYNTGSFLVYNTTGVYNRALEWSSNTAAAPGYPHHVTIQNATTVSFLNTTTFDIGCGGNLNLGASTAGTLLLTGYVQPYDLFVKGNINIGAAAAGTLTMSNSIGCDLFLTGNWTRNALGTVNFGSGNGRSVYFEGATDATITASGGQYFPYVRMQKTNKTNKVILADHVSIGFEVTFTKGTLDLGTNNKFFSLLSNANYDARVDVSDSANMAFVYGADERFGQFIVHRYMPARRAWRLVNAPFVATGPGTHSISQAWQEQGNNADGRDYTSANWGTSVALDSSGVATGGDYATHITGGAITDGFDISPNNNPSIKSYSAGTWTVPANTDNTNVNSKEGWLLFVRGDRKKYGEITNQYKAPTVTTLRPRGQIFLGQKTITASGMQVVGNPYASAVDYHTMTRGAGAWGAETYYVWDPYLGGSQGVGAFVALTWNGTNYTRISTGYGTGSYDNRYIASGAAIMVDFPAGGGTLSMNEANKNTDSNTTAFRPVRQLQTLLQTKDLDGSFYVADGAINLFGDNFNTEADLNDARKLGNVNENFAVQRNGNILAIERMKLTGDGDTVFYFMNKLQRKNYQLQFVMDRMELPRSTAAFLDDIYLKKKTPVALDGKTEIGFEVTADAGSFAPDRFRLVFRKSVKYIAVNAAFANSDVAVNWSVNDQLNIEKYDIERSADGINFTTVGTATANGDSEAPVHYSGLDASPAPGEYYYRIKSVSKNGIATYSDAIKVKVVKSSPSLFVFPNPVTNGVIQLQLNNKSVAGIYATVLFNSTGQAVDNGLISHAGGTATKTIQPKQRLGNGTYQLKVTGPDGALSIIKVVVANNE